MDDGDLVQLLWTSATALTPNISRFDTYTRLRDAVEASGAILESPQWWDVVKAQSEQAAVARANRSGDDDDDLD